MTVMVTIPAISGALNAAGGNAYTIAAAAPRLDSLGLSP
jgi:hypothetical protein